MVEPLNDSFMRAISRGAFKAIWKVQITIAKGWTLNEDGSTSHTAGLDKTYTWVSGGVARFGYAASILDVGALSTTLDPLTRKTTASGVEVIFIDDGSLRAIAGSEILQGHTLRLYLGTDDLAEEHYEKRFEGSVTDALPQEDGTIRVNADDWRASEAFKASVTYQSIGENPYAVLYHLVALVAGNNINPSTFNPPASRMHWLTSITSGDSESWSPISGGKTETGEPLEFGLDELIFILGGCVRYRQYDAQTEWVEFNPTAPAIRVLTRDDVLRVTQIASNEYRYNAISTKLNGKIQSGLRSGMLVGPLTIITYGSGPLKKTELAFKRVDRGAVGRAGGHVKQFDFESRLFRNRAHVVGAKRPSGGYDTWDHHAGSNSEPESLTPDSLSIVLYAPAFAGISGSIVLPFGVGWPVSPERLGYLMIVGSGKYEIVSVKESAPTILKDVDEDIDDERDYVASIVSSESLAAKQQYVEYVFHERGLFGTEPQSFHLRRWIYNADSTDCWAYDVTALVECVGRFLDRFRDGIPILEVLAHPRHMDLEYGDAISLEDALPMAYGVNGVSSADVFEVCAKEEQLDGDEPCVRLKLARLHSAGPERQDLWLHLHRQGVLDFAERALAKVGSRGGYERYFDRFKPWSGT